MRYLFTNLFTRMLPIVVACPLLAQSVTAQPVRDWRMANERAILTTYFELLSIPNISRDNGDTSANVPVLRRLLSEQGFTVTTSADRYPEDANAPVVFARYQAENLRGTLLLYIHYDGQPVNRDLWVHCAPFQPCLVDGDRIVDIDSTTVFDPEWRIYARSASDDKAPIMSLVQAMAALRATGQAPTWNLIVILDGQEESGAGNFRRYVQAHPEEFQADLAITIDGPRHPSTLPTMYYGVRGGASLLVKVHTAAQDLHSGNYGNWAPDASVRLGRLLTSMKAEDGTVTIDGFYDQVTPLTETERAAVAAIPDIEDELADTFGIAAPEQANQRLEAKLNLPTLNILAMDSGGGLSAPSRTAIPAFAQARIAMRLVNGIDPQRQQRVVIDHVRDQGYQVIENREPTLEELQRYPLLASVHYGGGRAATRVSMEEPLGNSVARALTLDGVQPVRLPTLGGSLPYGDFSEGLGIPTFGVALVNHDNNQHGPNENLKLTNLWQGIEIVSRLVTMPAP
jgi:acetylornithine deacetylase/succinyl-diaminopimelate desuccinylase-like protein